MATDGVKIIDGDLANDVYTEIMDLYDSDASIETISKQIPFVKDDYGPDSDFYHEIFVTAYGLAFWEIGALTEEMLSEIKRIIALGAGVRVWTNERDEKEGQKRKKELDKLLIKISHPNLKVRKRKKYATIKKLYFQPDDLLTFKLSDEYYYAVICAKVTQYRGQCTYDMVTTTYRGKTRPSLEDIKSSSIVARKLGSGFTPEQTLSMQRDVNEIWLYSNQENFFLGLSYFLITHKDIIGFKEKLEIIDRLKIKESLKEMGSFSYISSFDELERRFLDLERHITVFREEKYPVELLSE